MIARYATDEDMPKVCRLALLGYREFEDLAPEKLNPLKMVNWVYEARETAPCVVLEKDGEVIGMWGLCTMSAKWSDDTILADYILFIEPEHRSIKAIQTLTKAVTDTADRLGLAMRLNYLIKDKFDAHKRLYEGMGFQASGIIGFYKGQSNGK